MVLIWRVLCMKTLLYYMHPPRKMVKPETSCEAGVLCANGLECNIDTIRYLSVHDNKYIRYFKGHTGQ